MKLLSVSFPRHDGSISYFDGKVVRYIKLERIKQNKRFHYNNRWEWIREIKNVWGLDITEVDEIVFDFHVDPWSNDYDFNNIPLPIKRVLDGEINAVRITEDINPFKHYFSHKNMWFIGHHYAHSLSSWMLLDKKTDVDIVIDGLGDNRTWSVFKNDTLVASGDPRNGSFGGEMFKCGNWLNIKASHGNDIPGKVMGIQSYGNLDEQYLDYLRQFNYSQITEVFSIENWQRYKKNDLLGNLTPLDWIKTVHQRCGELILDIFNTYCHRNDVISYSGGVAQNVIWNTELKNKFPNLVIPPHSSDEGLSLGGIEWLRKKNNLPRFTIENFPYSQSDFSPKSIPEESTIFEASNLLSKGKIIAWYQGNGEVGPRALGNRSILMDPRIKNGRDLINQVKNREKYRPFGASILEEYTNQYFDIDWTDPYMLFTAKLKVSGLDSITHIDSTCRIQTVSKRQNPIYRRLLERFYELTRCPILLNTSLNTSGLPLSGYPEVALDLFNSTSIDAVFIGNEFFVK